MKRFSPWQIALHWITLVLIAIAYAAIELRGHYEDDYDLFNLLKTIHFNVGVLILLCMVFRIVLRHRYPNPPIVPDVGLWQKRAAAVMHAALYACFFALPILGLLTQWLNGASWSFMGIDITGLKPPMRAYGRTLKDIHETLGNIGYYLIGLHTVAALFHHYIQKDNTLLRMLPKCLVKSK